MTRRSFVVAVAQARQGADIGQNLREIGHFLHLASRASADLACFPECALTGYGPARHPSPAAFDPDAVEAALAEVADLARALKMAVVVGAHLPSGGGWTNSAVLVGASGRIAGRYDKAHLYDRDREFYRAGDAPPSVLRAGRARLGLQVCFDIRFPEPFRALALAGAETLLVPSHIHGPKDMWKGPIVEAHVRSRAAENGRFVVFANAAGPAQNVPSMIADPRGEIVVRAPRGARRLLLAELDLDKVSDDFLDRRRTDLYH